VAEAFADRLRAAASFAEEQEEEERELSAATPLQQLRELAARASSETVRVQALKALVEREDRLAEQRRTRRAVEDGPDLEYARWVSGLTEEQLDRELADLEAANADPLPRRDEDAVEAEVERRVQLRLRDLGLPTAALDARNHVAPQHDGSD
jgi:hypothetical protein